MKTRLLKMARRLWVTPDIPPRVARYNTLAWARAVDRLGDRWLLAKHQPRKTTK